MGETILQLFPAGHRAFWSRTAGVQERIQEIRLRAGRPVVLYMDGREIFLTEQRRDNQGTPEHTVPIHFRHHSVRRTLYLVGYRRSG
mgnify:CR=1 FL=1